MVFKIVDEGANEVGTIAGNEDGRKVLAGFAITGGVLGFAMWAEVDMGLNYVIFTTVAKSRSHTATTPTRVGSEEV